MKLIDATITAEKLSATYGIHLSDLVDTFADIPTVDAAPVSELPELRDSLYSGDQITMRGLEKLNRLISKYDSRVQEVKDGR